ncbi:MAG: hypothetical protein WDO15_04145 [Bacteroidota bacterium]
MKEIGVRKVVGSLKKQIAAQFLTESVLLTLFAGDLFFHLIFFTQNILRGCTEYIAAFGS